MVEIIEGILNFLFFALFVALIVGLIKPKKIIRWSWNPTRWKVLGWWLLSSSVISILVGINDTFYTSEQRIVMIEKDIVQGDYSSAISNIEKIKDSDSLYAKAQILFARADSLRLIDEAEKKAIVDAKATEKEAQQNVATEVSVEINRGSISPSSISSVEEAEIYVNGKTFTATPMGGVDGFWHKVSFSNGSYSHWTTLPSSGVWGSPTKGIYFVEERRYPDSGQRYFLLRMTPEGVNSPYGCFAFNIKETTFAGCHSVAFAVEGETNN